ncbi:M23 family metallopeptidase [Mycolicibacterium sediminis]|nr:M23 family metallopeptidase [Mycolicibacterium sediminis]
MATRLPLILIGIALTLTSPLHHEVWLSAGGAALIMLGVASAWLPIRRVDREPVTVLPPVRGRWLGVNSPADKVPSHGVHSNGQTYAIDFVYWPDEDVEWKAVRPWPMVQQPTAFPGFGQPVFAPVTGTVVHAADRRRDHWSRKSWPALAYFFIVEGPVRELIGPSMLLGNHVVVDAGDGTFAVLAHLRRGSVSVEVGQTVDAGDRVAECGNSGNTTEPHLHFQLMDRRRASTAAGIPFRFAGHATPGNGEPLVS